ncbi:Rossmann-like and DUF2520 domain-containing protein [Maribacter sp. 2304DJ31-5]|uniref:Rossmann-like and DUF2520 domain-containing protein n=1 Tax=Maribacter sp. 2304DJ31-5 TaxID=3386273 RepID=UPI0039BC5913
MISITIIGTGNLAEHLAFAFSKAKGIRLNQVIGRNRKRLDVFSKFTSISSDYDALLDSDIYILAIKDGAIHEVAKKISYLNGLVVHTAGAMNMEVLGPNKNIGVFYPLQTFTNGQEVDFTTIPICIEANSEESLGLLLKLGTTLSTKVQVIPSKKRKILHATAVFVNNFPNYLYAIAKEICDDNQLEFNLLNSLISETANKVNFLTPNEAQTGPARRGDQKTMHEHLNLLKEEKHREIYILLSNAIKATNGEKL